MMRINYRTMHLKRHKTTQLMKVPISTRQSGAGITLVRTNNIVCTSLTSLHTTHAFLHIEKEEERKTLINAANLCVNLRHDNSM